MALPCHRQGLSHFRSGLALQPGPGLSIDTHGLAGRRKRKKDGGRRGQNDRCADGVQPPASLSAYRPDNNTQSGLPQPVTPDRSAPAGARLRRARPA
ncbi:hypothetical protein G6F31_020829 [Rhizopus arrhizus]|nr:hypothetical protein G6F31_020829 [Rhizopus arrhizus]